MENKINRILALLRDRNIHQKDVLSFREAQMYLDVSKSFLYKITASKGITFFKPSGKLIYFKKSDLDEWLLHNKHASVAATEDEINNYLIKGKNGR